MLSDLLIIFLHVIVKYDIKNIFNLSADAWNNQDRMMKKKVHAENHVETWVPKSVSSRPSSWALLLSLLSLYCPCPSVSTLSPPLLPPSPSLPLRLPTSSFVAHGLLGPHNCQETCGLPGAVYTALPLVVNLTQFQLLWRCTAGKNIEAKMMHT